MAGTTARFERKPKRLPVFVAKAKIGENRWRYLGAAWGFKDGSPGFSIQLDVIPTNWDGKLSLFVPEPDEEVPEHDAETGEIIR